MSCLKITQLINKSAGIQTQISVPLALGFSQVEGLRRA